MDFTNNEYLLIKKRYLKFLRRRETQGKPIIDKIGKLNNFYLPLSKWIYSIYKKDNKLKIIGLSGGQGAGKSTITAILKFILKFRYRLDLCIFSIDDFYKTKFERKKMSERIHPLFLTRGVPGTHDLKFINQTINNLKKKNFKPVMIPRFDKSIDDRAKKTKWVKIKKPPNIIIFEGWCVGARHQKISDLKKPLNIIEKKYDPDLKWRKKVNDQLKRNYKNTFNKVDKLVYLKAPSFKHIFIWRLLQEKKLELTSKNKDIMSKSKIKDFIMYYERITKQMMKDFPKISDLTIFLDKNHRSKKMKYF
jgi:D-glycerate 3-kinase